jgi:hypothetical protein
MQEVSFAAARQPRWRILLSVVRELGLRQVALYGAYQLGIRTGFYRWRCNPNKATRAADGINAKLARPLWHLPSEAELSAVLGEAGRGQLLAEADEIIASQVRLFGGPAAPLRLATPGPLAHWTAYERGDKPAGEGLDGDIKWIWEPGRLGWAYTLGRAYLLSRDERYAVAFWDYIEGFLDANPPYLGPHWASAQEVALRLIALTFACQVFRAAACAEDTRTARLAQAVAIHAARIPPTLVYARAQNNNHLLAEAAGLYTAGLFLPDHPQAQRWRDLGWRWFNRAIQSQVASDGAYVQHSTNYHRLMLQAALWVSRLAESQGQALPHRTCERLAVATRWLLRLLDPPSGGVPNLGPNDGAHILPLTVCPQGDYRPVLQAAGEVFLGERPFVPGAWDEMALWLGGGLLERSKYVLSTSPQPEFAHTPHVLRSPDGASWAYLRAARFTGRPGHADQLHLDLWWRGLNLAQDAGTYLYNARPPWDNALARSEVHNTVVIDGRDQMYRAGRFLYINWAQAEVLKQELWEDGALRFVSARHNGYQSLGLWHQRQIAAGLEGDWEIKDLIYPLHPPGLADSYRVNLHWLLPDWSWEVQAEAGSPRFMVTISSPFGPVQLLLELDSAVNHPVSCKLLIARAGERVWGEGAVPPVWGWSSPTYGTKIPALSIRFTLTGSTPLGFISKFAFPPDLRQEGK